MSDPKTPALPPPCLPALPTARELLAVMPAGRVPAAYYVSPRCPRWRRSELRTALEATRVLSRT